MCILPIHKRFKTENEEFCGNYIVYGDTIYLLFTHLKSIIFIFYFYIKVGQNLHIHDFSRFFGIPT